MVHGSACVFLSQPLAQSTDLVLAMKQCPVTYAALPPLMLDDLAVYLKNTANYEPFQRLKYITQVSLINSVAGCCIADDAYVYDRFAGAPLRPNVGDFLAAHDIRLQSVVGCTGNKEREKSVHIQYSLLRIIRDWHFFMERF